MRSQLSLSPCELAPSASVDSTAADEQILAKGVRLSLPHGAVGPAYEFDDVYHSRPTWSGPKWHVHFVFGTGGLLEFAGKGKYCSLDDDEIKRRVYVGKYIFYGVLADVWRINSPDKVTSVLISLEPNGLSEAAAFAIVKSSVPSWGH